MRNLLLLTDSYKATHFKQYPSGTEKVYSYFESRGGKFDNTVFFGLQYYLIEYFDGAQVTREKINEASEMWKMHFGRDLFNKEGWEYILEAHGGRLPLKIKAVPEGTSVPVSNVLMTVENTDPNCYWLTNWVETLLVQLWYGCTVATQSREMKKVIAKYLKATGGLDGLPFKLHDFGFRGVSSVESAALGGAAHLVNFMGTDTMAANILLNKYYESDMGGFSIPASEHSTITSWGKEGELDAYRNMLEQYPEGLVACVSDSFDIYNACSNLWGDALKDKVLNRDGTLVVRPDSGYPPKVVVEVLSLLGKAFGKSVNEEGFAVLPPQVRVIQGDGIDYEMVVDILEHMKEMGWSADNIAFGSGGALLQKMNRDTQKFAFKCSSVVVDGEERDVFKDPVTDSGKQSKRGRLKLVRKVSGDQQTFITVSSSDEAKMVDSDGEPGFEYKDELQTVFLNGNIIKRYTLEEVRERAKL